MPARRLPDPEALWHLEAEQQQKGYARIAGVDEAGRGPIAGPVVAAAIVLSGPVEGVFDSKQLTPRQRERAYEALVSGDHAVGLGVVPAAAVDARGIQDANFEAMRVALANLPVVPCVVLVDGFHIPNLDVPQERVLKGDTRSLSIAAASIIAKVARDRMLHALDAAYPLYGFKDHKGYGTPAHLAALAKWGPCPEHRKSFAPLAQRPRA